MDAAWYVSTVNPKRASLRYRCLYPIEELRRQGYSAELYDPARAERYRCVVFDAWNLFPTIDADDAAVDRIVTLALDLKRRGIRVVLDNCDNQFAGNDADPAWKRGLDRLRDLASNSDALVTASVELAAVMRDKTGFAGRIDVIGDPAEERIRYPGDSMLRSALSLQRKLGWWRYWRHRRELAGDRHDGRTPLVWFGSHGNSFAEGGMLELKTMRDDLEQINSGRPISLSVISNNRRKFDQNFGGWTFPVRYSDWNRVTFLASLRLHDISLIPSQVNDFTRCKSANRIVLSLFHGLAVVADVLPSYREFAEVTQLGDTGPGLTGYLADPALRQRHVRMGRELIARRYTLPAIAAQWRQVVSG